MASLADIRAGLAANLASVGATLGCQISPYMLSSPTPPAVHIVPAEEAITYDRAMGRGHDDWLLLIQAFVGITSDIGAQKNLDRFLASSGAGSVKEAAESDRTLGGVAADLHVTGASGYRIYTREGAAPVLGAEWTVRVLASGT